MKRSLNSKEDPPSSSKAKRSHICSEEPDDPFNYNTIEIPTVVGFLKNILAQYPDNGQIIKELVQHAEDAGATVVEVLHDAREVKCPKTRKDIQRFLKGPALCLYNDGTFTEDDWSGIRKLSDSIKKNDPLKVGQFGLGFKSVFHITDFVTIISGDKVLFMDPSEPENKMCRIVSLKKLTSICPLEDCLHLWSSYISTQNITDGQFPATLFWFPLRQSPSNISNTIYSYNHVIRLFESFSVEASLCLTFLKSIEKICLKRIIKRNKNPVTTHEVKLISPVMTEVQQKRKVFRQKLVECSGCPSLTITCDYEVTVESVRCNHTEQQMMHILHYLPGSSDPCTATWRGEDSCKHMPLVGIAAPVITHSVAAPSVTPSVAAPSATPSIAPPTTAHNVTAPTATHGAASSTETHSVASSPETLSAASPTATHSDETSITAGGTTLNSGHIFCFLPLPLETDNNTNLPVQINGFFALDQNRRHVKWKTEESSSEPDVLWNEDLVSRVVVEAYFTLLQNVLHDLEAKSSPHQVETWYGLLPHIDSTKGRWKNLATELWSRLKSLPILYSDVKGCMMTPKDVLTEESLNDWPQHVSNTVRGFLREHGFPVASVPESLLSSLQSLGSAPSSVMPQVLRKHMKTLKSIKKKWNRSYLLEYVISDEDYSDLEGIPLLPLHNGKWDTFSPSGRSVYICGESAGAFLGLEDQILSIDLSSQVVQHMHNVAEKGVSQLKKFSSSLHGVQLLSQSAQFVQQSSISQQQLECWLPKVWLIIKHLDLQTVKNIALVPSTEILNSTKLIDLSSATIVQKLESPLSQAAVEALELLNVQVIPGPPEYVQHHQLHNYFSTSDARGVSQALLKVLKTHDSHDLSCTFNNHRSDEQVHALINVTEIHNLQPQIRELYKELYIFKASWKNNVVSDISINICDKIFPEVKNFPVSFPETLIVPSNEAYRQLAKNLGATELSKEKLCVLALKKTYSENDTKKLVAYVLEDRFLQNNEEIQNQLKLVRFVPNISGNLFCPNQLYDPEDIDNDVLISEDLNPQTDIHKYYPLLRSLGMRRVQNMPISDLIQMIQNLHANPLTEIERVKKSKALLSAINRRSDCQKICEAVKSVRFVYGKTSKPESYPDSLIWATSSEAYSPQDMKSYSHFKNSLGSEAPLLQCSHIPNVASNFGWIQKPSVNKVINHLQNIIKVYNNTEAGYFEIIKETYKQLSEYINTPDECHLLSLSATPCVFTELGFKDPKQVYILPQEGDLPLLPYMCQLPFELRNYSSLFCALGCFETQSKELFLKLLRQIQQHHSSGRDADVDQDRRIVLFVLHILENFLQDIPPSELLLPVENSDESLELIGVEQCTYSEQSCDWLDSEELGVRVVHSSVGSELARALGVAPLKKHLLAGEEAFMEWGQHEPLTTRLHNLLRQYRDGVAVIKELVQNADDACATTISFLYDERQNEDAHTRLINNKLQEFQGPALWAYNDAMFTEDDFSNLRKLGGGTKEYQSSKIGKFGLGFCSVYNLTDVPSFISGSNYVIFDPHLTYLDSNNQTPGVRYNFSNERSLKMLQKLHGQFKPFIDVFGCNIQQTKKFNGSLFRFPLRTEAQARSSEISSVSYRHKEMTELLKMFSEIIGELLLFTQTIKEIKVFHLNKNASSPTEKVLLFESSSTIRKPSFHGNSVISNETDETIMKRVANLFNNGFKWNGEYFQETTFSEINVVCSEKGRKLCHIDQGNWTVNWLTSWHCGNGASFKFTEVLAGRALPLSAVAVPLKKETDGWQPIKLSELPHGFYKESHMHCFLPLPVTTPLPVQVNGCFEVASDRTSLKTQTEDDRRKGIDWNETLMSDAVNATYCSLLSSLQIQGLSQKCPYYCIWPIKCDSDESLVLNLAKHFYESIVIKDLEVFRSRGKWRSLSVCRFLDESFYELEEIGKIAFEYIENLIESEGLLSMILLPKNIYSGFQSTSVNMINQDVFLSSYFIPNMSEQFVTAEKRNKLTLHIIDTKQPCFEKLQNICCIPTKPKGKLRVPSDLIDPKSRISKMFSLDDERFPESLFTKKHLLYRYNRHMSLLDLGMNSSNIPTEIVITRAETITALHCHNCAVERAFEILHYIGTQNNDEQDNIAERIRNVSFLPVMPKPLHWPLPWKADILMYNNPQVCIRHAKDKQRNILKSIRFSKPADMCSPDFIDLVSSTSLLLLLNETVSIQNPVIKKLGIIVDKKKLPINSVCQQLKILATLSPVGGNIKNMCHEIYKYFEDKIHFSNSDILECLVELRSEKILLTKHGFMEPALFALSSDTDCSPDLFSVQGEGLGMYQDLMKALGIEPTFQAHDVLQVLIRKKEKYESNILSESEILQISKLLTLMFNILHIGSSDCQLSLHLLHLPDAAGYLYPISKLCCDDGATVSSGKFHCLHNKFSLSQEMRNWLGIKTKSRQYIENSSSRIHFGQNEPLTTRLRNILDDYPCDSGIMKELLQNADDAGATEVAFIKDLRNLSTERLFDKSWAPLQGPSLSVYNNKCFTKEDLQNIQDLGNSSKKQDPAQTGQYGIGFNAVYHITDAPSFLTRGPDVPQGETLCMFDPHCRYDPMATPESPGVQFINLNDLRIDYPDSFEGYLEHNFLQQQGTIFRFPLRTVDSQISKSFPVSKLIEKLKEFQFEMPKCLLFLRNVRKISIMNISDNGEPHIEYWVKSVVHQQNVLSKQQNMMEDKRKFNHDVFSVFNTDMMRASYEIIINDSNKAEYMWYIVQQLGAEKKDTVPEIVKDAFFHKQLSLLPHAGAAVLLKTNQEDCQDLFTTSCYLPLPVKSGLPFSVNGHFTLNSARRDLWTGLEDYKAKWNAWLMKEVVTPAAVCAVDYCRKFIFPENKNRMTQHQYKSDIQLYQNTLPDVEKVHSNTWKTFIKWFYEYIIDQQLHFFDAFIPHNDKQKAQKGELKWYAFCKTDNKFLLYFVNDMPIVDNVLNTLKRLGMKVGSSFMRDKLNSVKIECHYVTQDVTLKFLRSWDKDYPDKCNLILKKHIIETPFLSTRNVCDVFRYLLQSKTFLSELEGLPLLVTNDNILKQYDFNKPVFFSSYCSLLPKSGNEFLCSEMVNLLKESVESYMSLKALKPFLLKDLADRLHKELDSSEYHANEDHLPLNINSLPDAEWLKRLWEFVVNNEHKETYMIWYSYSEYIRDTLGKWVLYPFIENEKRHLIAVKNAWRVLDFRNNAFPDFQWLPVPHPCSISPPPELDLAATSGKPSFVLDNFHFHRERIAEYVSHANELELSRITQVLDYFGQHCYVSRLCKIKLRSLSIFEDVSGVVQKLENRKFIVPVESKLDLREVIELANDNNIVTLKKATSENVKKLYIYLNSHCHVNDIDIYILLILPKFADLVKDQRTYFLKKMRDELTNTHYRKENCWSQSERDIVHLLKRTSLIELNGILLTADKFYDPFNPVFKVMKQSKLPEEYKKYEWQNFLKLAGMVQELTAEMFVQYAASLSSNDSQVEHKSKVHTEYLFNNSDKLMNTFSQIKNIEFLVPEKEQRLEQILPHFSTSSGLASFASSVPLKFSDIVWTTASLLPQYATCYNNIIRRRLNILDSPPKQKVLEHIEKFCRFMKSNGMNSESIVYIVKKIYDYLQKDVNSTDLLAFQSIPIVHLLDHKTFVTANLVIQNLEEEIIPYLYKVPIKYGEYIDVFKKLGAHEVATCDVYAQVLKMIFEDSNEEKLHPGEYKCMISALKGLLKNEQMLKNLTVTELYLPTKEGKLKKSVEIFVSDIDYCETSKEDINISIFVGFEALNLSLKDVDFVKLLPDNLQPKYLSRVVKEDIDSSTEEISTDLLKQIREFLVSDYFRIAIIRIINHDRTAKEYSINKLEGNYLRSKFDTVKVKQVKKITTVLKYNEEELGRQTKEFFVKVIDVGVRQVTLYICEAINKICIARAMLETFTKLLNITSASVSVNLLSMFMLYETPHGINEILNKLGITAGKENNFAHNFCQMEIGSYLDKTFIPLLNNELCQFHEGEIACMKKYILGKVEDVDENIYIIIKVKCLVRRHDNLLMDEYEVETEPEAKSCMTVQAHQLYKFVRTNRRDFRSMVLTDGVTDDVFANLSEEKILKNIKKKIIEILKVEDEKKKQSRLRHLNFKWHPDKNRRRVDLSTRVVQYIQQLLTRSKRGEVILDDDDI